MRTLTDTVTFLTTLSNRAAEAGLSCLVIGGNAIIAHGFPRQTRDIDLLVREADRRKWDTLIVALGYTQHQIARSFQMYNPIDRSLPPVDLMVVNESTFSKMMAEAEENELHGVRVRLPRLSHLIAMKLHALRSDAPHRRSRDLLDVLELIRVNRIDLAEKEYREIFDQYADARTREEIGRHLSGSGSRIPDA